MAQRKNRLGARIVGEEEAARQAEEDRQTVGAQHVLGPRVTGQRQQAEVNKLGVRVTDAAPQHQHSLSVDEIESTLEENPTFFDSLYLGELNRVGGPRVAALKVFAVVEEGIKGQGRAYIMDEINSLLGVSGAPGTPQDAAYVQREMAAKKQAYEEQQERQKSNLKNVETAQVPLTIEGRVREIMSEDGEGEGGGEANAEHTPTPKAKKKARR